MSLCGESGNQFANTIATVATRCAFTNDTLWTTEYGKDTIAGNTTETFLLPHNATGDIFAGALATVIAAQCAFLDSTQWPKDYATEVLKRHAESLSFDFVIIGAGTAGSLLANRLAKHNPFQTVLLIEAGGDPGLNSEVPALIFENLKTDIDWQYEIEANDDTCKGFHNNTCVMSNGKALGGSGSINVMVYLRGSERNYNNWESYGNLGWSYNDVLPYFEKLETEYEFSKHNTTKNPLIEFMEASYEELNVTKQQLDRETVVGMGVQKFFIKDGRRLNTAKIYLSGVENLFVMKNTVGQKIIIDTATKIATGVEIRHVSGTVIEIKANKEVIISAGSIATPKLLMLSGIGPKNHLKEKQIPCLLDLPVGENLQDHIFLPLFMKTNLSTVISSELITTYIVQYLLTNTGPLSNLGVSEFLSFINTNNETDVYPDVQLVHVYYPTRDKLKLKPLFSGLSYKEEIVQEILQLNKKTDVFGIFSILLQPKSRGKVLLADKKPASKPIIRANYLEHPADSETLLKAIEFIRKLENTTKFKELDIKLTKIDIKECNEAREYWDCYIKYMATSLHHVVGTAKMGTKGEKSAVVDENLLVHGMKNLRVVDASIMPDIPGGSPMAATLMIAEKAADVLSKLNKYKDEL